MTAVVLAIGALFLVYPKDPGPEGIAWEPYSESRLQSARSQNQTVFVDFTAAWCLTCQVNERTTLSSHSVRRAFREQRVLALKADWTNRDPMITTALSRFGRNGVPVYALYLPGEEPRLLPALLSPGHILDALKSNKNSGGPK